MRPRLSAGARRAFAALCVLAALSSPLAAGTTHAPARTEHEPAADRPTPDANAQAPSAGHASQRISGRATRVQDGDSFVMLASDGRRLTIRISGIDAPEKGQPFADRSRQRLGALLADRELSVVPVKTDVYGRLVAQVRTADVDVGLEQLRAGMAWHFRRYARDQSPEDRQAYARAEAQARDAREGLWRERSPTEPWRYREERRHGSDPRVGRGTAERLAQDFAPAPWRRCLTVS